MCAERQGPLVNLVPKGNLVRMGFQVHKVWMGSLVRLEVLEILENLAALDRQDAKGI